MSRVAWVPRVSHVHLCAPHEFILYCCLRLCVLHEHDSCFVRVVRSSHTRRRANRASAVVEKALLYRVARHCTSLCAAWSCCGICVHWLRKPYKSHAFVATLHESFVFEKAVYVTSRASATSVTCALVRQICAFCIAVCAWACSARTGRGTTVVLAIALQLCLISSPSCSVASYVFRHAAQSTELHVQAGGCNECS